MKILFDECVDIRVCRFLRRKGYDAGHVKETKWQSLSNSALYDAARPDYGLFISTDRDFSDPAAHPPTPAMGILYVDITPSIAKEIVPAFERLLARHTLDHLIGKHTTLRHDGFEIH